MKIYPSIHPSESNCAIIALILAAGLSFSSTVSATLMPRTVGTDEVVYDSDLNITWLRNANVNGNLTWTDASLWAANLVYAGFDDWRLPTTLVPDASCQSPSDSYGYNCTGSELGYFFYQELGGKSNQSITTTHNENYNLFNNIVAWNYWSQTDYSPTQAYKFNYGGGTQGADFKSVRDYYAWAVRTGDVIPMPEPGVIGLLLVGGIGWISAMARRGRRLSD